MAGLSARTAILPPLKRRSLLALGVTAVLAPRAYGQAARSSVEDYDLAEAVGRGRTPAANSSALLEAIRANAGRRLRLPPLTIEFEGVALDADELGLGLEIVGQGATGYRGSVLKNVGAGDALTITNRSKQSYNGPIRLTGFAIHGHAASGSGIVAEQINGQCRFEFLWFDGHGKNSVVAKRCYGMEIRSCISNNPGANGFEFVDAANNIVLDHLHAFQAKGANIKIAGAQTSFAPVLNACDVSYSRGVGLWIDNAVGASVTGFYAEDCVGPSALIGRAARSFTISGGYNQNGQMVLDGAGLVEGVFSAGKGGIAAGPLVEVKNCTFATGALLKRGA
ncbi:MAG TPA: right-handed parallel beta-helix repeat-containing protein [Caulobacteraceae bacterium]